jgi:hypothetical protein
VHAVICVLGAELPRSSIDIDGVRIISGPRHLLRELRHGKRVLSGEEVVKLVEMASFALGSAEQ